MFNSLLTSFLNLFRPPARPLKGETPRRVKAAPQPPPADLPQVQQLIGKVASMTSAVAQDVGQHKVNIQAISAELSTVAQSDPTAVAAIVCKLLVANQELQGRLQHAEDSLKQHSQQLKAAVCSARTDELTGLLNRRALDEELRRCLACFRHEGSVAALFMLDLDHFKQFNDTFGHLAGDQALVHAAGILREHSHSTDIVARYGGEEFVVVFAATTAAAVRQRAEQLRMAIGKQVIKLSERQVQISASAGLAEIALGDSIADWLVRADRALYAAKSKGRNCACEARGLEFERIGAPANEPVVLPSHPDAVEPPAPRALIEASAELAADAFADTTFTRQVARRIAEWRRGGATLTVILARLDGPVRDNDDAQPDHAQSPIRVAQQVVRACVREMDLMTRWQANGLAFLLPSTSAADAKLVARRMRAALAANHTDDARPRLSICIGIAEGIEGNDAKRVLERAWLALDAARSAGCGNIYIHDGLKPVGVRVVAISR